MIEAGHQDPVPGVMDARGCRSGVMDAMGNSPPSVIIHSPNSSGRQEHERVKEKDRHQQRLDAIRTGVVGVLLIEGRRGVLVGGQGGQDESRTDRG